MAPRILILGKLVWGEKDLQEQLGGIAEVIHVEDVDRAAFLKGFESGGKYEGAVGVLHTVESNSTYGNIDKELVNALPSTIKWIAHKGAGYDDVDVIACRDKGITVSHTPKAVDEGTAETALFLLLATVRNFTLAEASLRAGNWKPKTMESTSYELSSRTLGVLGLGGIGGLLAEMVRPMGMRVIYHNRKPASDAPKGCEYFADLDEMLAQTDVLSVHIPLNDKTEHFVNDSVIRKMKKGSVIINTARGKVIDEAAMIKALEDGHLSAIGLDVFPDEPKVNPRLLEFPTATLLPHVGTENQDSRHHMEMMCVVNLRDFLTKGKGENIVPECR
ncbi:D-isomer specific 2-hydroxyacid dehydrogenase [Pterulicium gracile]|uniref:D-isomer specific 2-hydroxyacid dehydrogenase n=1 Tax=Pterulicium gracile TaxID=1884261 RepID=A0A5C3QIS3_9AGAR|nr:D-isomer specific 2-hydroxyacid dehydrogenase [Pterula gracilis]